MKGLFKGCLTVPNALSLLRILLIPVFIHLFNAQSYLWALIVLFISAISDFFDGKIARRFNQVSELGKVLDPVSDKLSQMSIAVVLYLFFRESTSASMKSFSIVFLFFVAKEILMVLFGLVIFAFGMRTVAAEIWGKIGTLVFYTIMTLILAFGPEVGAVTHYYEKLVIPESVTMVLVVIAAVCAFIAFFGYLPGTYRMFKERSKNNKSK